MKGDINLADHNILYEFGKNKIEPWVGENPYAHETDRAIFQEAGRLGLIGCDIGLESSSDDSLLMKKFSMATICGFFDANVTLSLINSGNVAKKILSSSQDDKVISLAEKIRSGGCVACTAITEDSSGSAVSSLSTYARRHEDGWLLHGSKSWIINATIADYILVYAQIHDDRGATDQWGAFLVAKDSKGFSVTATRLDGAEGLGLGNVSLNNVMIPSWCCMIANDRAKKLLLHELNEARAYVAALAAGVMDRLCEETITYASQRQIGVDVLVHLSGWRSMMADAQSDLFVLSTALKQLPPDMLRQQQFPKVAAQLKLMATNMLQRHVPAFMHTHGAQGLLSHGRVLRIAKFVSIIGLIDGATEVLQDRVVRSVLSARNSQKGNAELGSGK